MPVPRHFSYLFLLLSLLEPALLCCWPVPEQEEEAQQQLFYCYGHSLKPLKIRSMSYSVKYLETLSLAACTDEWGMSILFKYLEIFIYPYNMFFSNWTPIPSSPILPLPPHGFPSQFKVNPLSATFMCIDMGPWVVSQANHPWRKLKSFIANISRGCQ